MRKILLLVVAAFAISACRSETPTERAERKLYNAGDELEDAARDLRR